jgi:hypothetical protein
MAWTPKYDAEYVEPIIANAIAVLKANEAAALAWASKGQLMESARVWRTSRWYNTIFPVYSIFPVETGIVEADDASHLDEAHSFSIEIENSGGNADKVTTDVIRRVRALDMIIRGSKPAELLKGMSLLNKPGALRLDISPHRYNYFGEMPKGPYQTIATFVTTISLFELRHH